MARSDEALIDAHRQGDATAFGELVRRYADSLLGYLIRMSRDRQQAEDFFQETFRKVHQKADTFEGRGRFKSWLFSIAANVAIDGMRKQSRQPKMISLNQNNDCPDCGALEASTALEAEKSTNPFQVAVLTEQKTQVQQALKQLPFRQRTALILNYYQGLTYKEVAQTMGCSLGTVKTHIFRALKTLADLLPDIQGGTIK